MRILCFLVIICTLMLANLVKVDAIRRRDTTHWMDAFNDSPSGGFTRDGERLSPIFLRLPRDFIKLYGSDGKYGTCKRIYRVLYQTTTSPDKECWRYYESEQSSLSDIADFYHTLVASNQFNNSIIFPLADRLGRVEFKANFLYMRNRGNDPIIMIDSTTKSKHVVCVQSIACEKSEADSLSASAQQVLVKSTLRPQLIDDATVSSDQVVVAEASNNDNGSPASSLSDDEGDAFWSTLLSTTKPKSWFLATMSLSGLSLLLLIALLISWLFMCRIRRLYLRRRCRGTCKFGCRCPLEIVRQANAEAAVCGPLDHISGMNGMSPGVNGSIRSGMAGLMGYNGAGTMTSSRWGSNNTPNGGACGYNKLATPLLTSMSQAPDKVSMMSPGSVSANYIVHGTDLLGSTLYTTRNPDNELPDITPPSAFFDSSNANGPSNGSVVESTLMNGSLASSAQSGRTVTTLNGFGKQGQSQQHQYLTSNLYPMLGGQWHDQLSPPTQPDGRHSASTGSTDQCDDCMTTRPALVGFQSPVYQALSHAADSLSKNGIGMGHNGIGQLHSSRLYSETERML